MTDKLYRALATVFFVVGLVFSLLEVIYGYFFSSWQTALQAIAQPNSNAWMHTTKFGETMLFGFLGLACLMASIAASSLVRNR